MTDSSTSGSEDERRERPATGLDGASEALFGAVDSAAVFVSVEQTDGEYTFRFSE